MLNYSTIEKIKDGIFVNTKYESNMKFYTPPKVVVFMNEYPNMKKLSEDRYEIYEINNPNYNSSLENNVQ